MHVGYKALGMMSNVYVIRFPAAGFYIPYIGTRILDASKAEKRIFPLNLRGLLINDGVSSSP